MADDFAAAGGGFTHENPRIKKVRKSWLGSSGISVAS
jgi:hypothetical protein